MKTSGFLPVTDIFQHTNVNAKNISQIYLSILTQQKHLHTSLQKLINEANEANVLKCYSQIIKTGTEAPILLNLYTPGYIWTRVLRS